MKRALIAAVLSLFVLAPAAPADDRTMKAAWDSQDPQFSTLAKSVDREMKRWADRGWKRDSKLIKLMKRGQELTARVEAAVNAEQPSTQQGTDAKPLILKSLATFKAHFAEHLKAIPRAPSKRAQRYGKNAEKLFDQSAAEAQQAKDLLKQVGVT